LEYSLSLELFIHTLQRTLEQSLVYYMG